MTTGWTWFAVRGDTLVGLASSHTGAFDPVSAQLHRPAAAGQDDPSEWGAAALILPLEPGATWPFLGHSEIDRKTVEAEERVEVPAGRFDALPVVRTLSVPGTDLRTTQWFSSIGVVQMEERLVTETDGEVRESLAGTRLVDYNFLR